MKDHELAERDYRYGFCLSVAGLTDPKFAPAGAWCRFGDGLPCERSTWTWIPFVELASGEHADHWRHAEATVDLLFAASEQDREPWNESDPYPDVRWEPKASGPFGHWQIC